MLERIGVLGASGFVGTHLIENWHLSQKAEVIPIVRSFASLGKIARFSLDWRLAEPTTESLTKAFRGINTLVHCATGDARTIESLVEPVYKACEKGGIRRIIYLSSAAIFGQNLPLGTNDFSKVPTTHIHPYNAAKAKAEKTFFKLRSKGSTELVILRPSVVYGPRSRWLIELVHKLVTGKAWWINDGQGIVNAIYIDNLMHAIERALLTPGDGQAFMVRDRESYTWKQFYQPFMEALGFDINAIKNISVTTYKTKNLAQSLEGLPYLQALKPYLPSRLKRLLKASLEAWNPPAETPTWYLPKPQAPDIDYEMAELFSNRWTFPQIKAQELLSYTPPINHERAVQACIEWLGFCGHPMVREM